MHCRRESRSRYTLEFLKNWYQSWSNFGMLEVNKNFIFIKQNHLISLFYLDYKILILFTVKKYKYKKVKNNK